MDEKARSPRLTRRHDDDSRRKVHYADSSHNEDSSNYGYYRFCIIRLLVKNWEQDVKSQCEQCRLDIVNCTNFQEIPITQSSTTTLQ